MVIGKPPVDGGSVAQAEVEKFMGSGVVEVQAEGAEADVSP